MPWRIGGAYVDLQTNTPGHVSSFDHNLSALTSKYSFPPQGEFGGVRPGYRGQRAFTRSCRSRHHPRAVLLRPILLFLLGFLVLCAFFDGLQRAFPYLATGSEVVFQAKLRDEARGAVFPIKTSGTKVIVFGNSSILAGLVSKHFDELARADGLETYTYNSGFPGHVEFVPQLKAMVDTGNAPDVVLLTKAWQPKRSGGIFKLPFADQELANTIFPFRNLIRDAASFAFTSRERGGCSGSTGRPRKI
jgi:hypothetical protein